VWHNYETRVDRLLSSILQDDELSEFAVNSLVRMTDVILSTKESDDKQIAKNCDFDRTRNLAYKMLTYSQTKLLQNMFEKQLFYRLAVVKIYGIKNAERKAARYAFYTDQFAEHLALSAHQNEVLPMLTESLRKLAPACFADGKANGTALYFCQLIESLSKKQIVLNGLWKEPVNHEEKGEQTYHDLCMLKSALSIENDCEFSKSETQTLENFAEILKGHK